MGEGGLHLVEGAEREMEAARLGRGPAQGPAPIPAPHSRAPGCRAGRPGLCGECHSPGCWVVATVGVRMGRGVGGPAGGDRQASVQVQRLCEQGAGVGLEAMRSMWGLMITQRNSHVSELIVGTSYY